MNTTALTRLIALAYAAVFTVAMAVGIDALAQHEHADHGIAHLQVTTAPAV
jgi:hypothetical protein